MKARKTKKMRNSTGFRGSFEEFKQLMKSEGERKGDTRDAGEQQEEMTKD